VRGPLGSSGSNANGSIGSSAMLSDRQWLALVASAVADNSALAPANAERAAWPRCVFSEDAMKYALETITTNEALDVPNILARRAAIRTAIVFTTKPAVPRYDIAHFKAACVFLRLRALDDAKWESIDSRVYRSQRALAPPPPPDAVGGRGRGRGRVLIGGRGRGRGSYKSSVHNLKRQLSRANTKNERLEAEIRQLRAERDEKSFLGSAIKE